MALTFAVSASIGLICLFYFIATLVSAAIDFFTPAADRTAAVPCRAGAVVAFLHLLTLITVASSRK